MSITIRRFQPEDAPALWEASLESVERVGPWMDWCRPDLSQEEIERYIQWAAEAWEQGESYVFVIVDSERGTIVGSTGLNHIQPGNALANIFYWVRTSYAGRGAATEATRLIARFGFETLNLQRIEIVAAVDNHASQRVAEKAGAVREGILRKRIRVHGMAHDAVMYSLIAEDLSLDSE